MRRVLTLFVLLFVLGPISVHPAAAQTCNRYLNASDGDDDEDGLDVTSPVQSLEHAFRTFPDGSVVCTTAGEYVQASDADGIQLAGDAVQDKSMTFVLETFGESTQIALTEDELIVDIGAGRVRFAAGTAASLRLGVGSTNMPDRFPNNTTFLHTFKLLSGTMELDGVTLAVGPSVGNPHYARSGRTAPEEAAIVRGRGSLVGPTTFLPAEPVPRVLTYIGSSDRASGPETPPTVERLELTHDGGTIRFDDPIDLTGGGSIVHTSTGTTLFEAPVGALGASTTTIRLDGTGTLRFLENLSIHLDQSAPGLITHTSSGTLGLTDVDVTGSATHTATIVHDGPGPLILESLESDGPVVTTIHDAPGLLHLGRDGAQTTVASGIINRSGRDIEIVGEATIRGAFDNDGSVALAADAAIDGPLDNSGTIDLGPNTLRLSGTADHSNTGTISSESVDEGGLQLAGDFSLTSQSTLPSIVATEGTQTVVAPGIVGSVEADGSADLTLLETPRIQGSAVTRGGSLTLPSVVVDGQLVSEAGSIVLSGDVEAAAVRIDADGALVLGEHRLEVDGDFLMDGGTFDGAAGTLVLGGENQTLQSRPDLAVGALVIPSSIVDVTGGPVTVVHRISIGDIAIVRLGEQSLILQAADLTVEGAIETGLEGEIVFAGADQVLAGSALLGNVRLNLATQTDDLTISQSSVTQAGRLTLDRGRLVVGPSSSYTLIGDDSAPVIQYDLTDDDGDGQPDAGSIAANTAGFGTFSVPDTGFDLAYSGALTSNAVIPLPPVDANLVDLTFAMDATADPVPTISLPASLEFAGDLFVGSGTRLNLGDLELHATGNDVMHILEGRIDAQNGAVVMEGGSIGGRPEAGPSIIEHLTLRGDASIDDLARITGMLLVESGAATLSLASDDGEGYLSAGNAQIVRIMPDGGLTLRSHVQIVSAIQAEGGRLTFNDFDIVLTADARFTASEADLEQGSGTGRVVAAGQAFLRSVDATIPRLLLDAGDQTVTLSGPTRIGMQLEHVSGTLDLQTYELAITGGSWLYHDGAYTGTGTVAVTGHVDAVLDRSLRLPNAAVRGPDAQLLLRSPDTANIALSVDGRLNISEGVLRLRNVDIILTGTLESKGNGEVVEDTTAADSSIVYLDGADIALDGPLSIPHVEVQSDSRLVPGSDAFIVGSSIRFPGGSLSGVTEESMRIGDGALIVRSGVTGLDERPSFDGEPSIVYDVAGRALEDARLETGPEIPESGLQDLTILAGENTIELTSPTVVNGTLLIASGGFEPTASLTIDRGGTVHLEYTTQHRPRFISSSYRTRGPITLIYTGAEGDMTVTDLSYPSRASVGDLIIRMGDSLTNTDRRIVLSGTRQIDRLVVDNATLESTFDLNGQTLLVTDDARIERGVVTSEVEALLEIQDALYVGEAARVQGVISATAEGMTTIDGTFEAFLLRSLGDVTVRGRLGGVNHELDAEAGLLLTGIPNVDLFGTNQTLTFANADSDRVSVDDMINRLTVQSVSEQSVARIVSARDSSHTLAVNRLILDNGLLSTGRNDVRLPPGEPGFMRIEGSRSHVVGRVSRPVGAEPAGKSLEFPLGSGGVDPLYRPLTVTFDEPVDPGTIVTASHVGRRSGSLLGLPLRGGDDILITDTAPFYWTLEATPSISPSVSFNMSVVATGFTQYGSAREGRLVRRDPSGDGSWELHGEPSRYDNAAVSLDERSALLVQTGPAEASITRSPTQFTVGIQDDHRDFARVQFVNVASIDLHVVVGDSVEIFQLDPRTASSFVRLDGSEKNVTLTAASSQAQFTTSVLEAGTDYYALVERDEFGNLVLRYVTGARAIPPIDQKEAVSVGFVNGIRDAQPLSFVRRGDFVTLFESVPRRTVSPGYVPFEAENAGFNIISPTTGAVIVSARADLSAARGRTVAAVAAGVIGGSGSDAPHLLFVTNEGMALPSHVQVSAPKPVDVPETFALKGNHPNPFSETTTITFDLPETAEVTVEVFDMLGRQVLKTPQRRLLPSANHHIEIDGGGLGSGAYLYRLTATTESTTRTSSGRMVLVR